MPYFNKFPLLAYDLTGIPNVQPELVRNVFFDLKIRDAIKQNALIYYPYYIKDNETPEDIAYKYYKDSNKHWLVMFANSIVDPQYDWPLSEMAFQNYIIAKYNSLANAQTLINHYTKTITSVDSATGIESATIVTIDQNTYNTTPAFTFQEINLQDGTTVAITTTTEIVSCWDYEYGQNEAKKQIQLLDAQYADQIQTEFDAQCTAAT